MPTIKLTRRQVLASSLAAGAAGAFGVVPSFGKAQDNVLYVRFDSDLAVIDPGYMVGGVDIETQKAVMPSLVEYATLPDGALGWQATVYCNSVTQRDDLHVDQWLWRADC